MLISVSSNLIYSIEGAPRENITKRASALLYSIHTTSIVYTTSTVHNIDSKQHQRYKTSMVQNINVNIINSNIAGKHHWMNVLYCTTHRQYSTSAELKSTVQYRTWQQINKQYNTTFLCFRVRSVRSV